VKDARELAEALMFLQKRQFGQSSLCKYRRFGHRRTNDWIGYLAISIVRDAAQAAAESRRALGENEALRRDLELSNRKIMELENRLSNLGDKLNPIRLHRHLPHRRIRNNARSVCRRRWRFRQVCTLKGLGRVE